MKNSIRWQASAWLFTSLCLIALSGCKEDKKTAAELLEECELGLELMSDPLAVAPELEASLLSAGTAPVLTEDGRILIPTNGNLSTGAPALIWNGSAWSVQATLPSESSTSTPVVLHFEQDGKFRSIFPKLSSVPSVNIARLNLENADGTFGASSELAGSQGFSSGAVHGASEDLTQAMIVTRTQDKTGLMTIERNHSSNWTTQTVTLSDSSLSGFTPKAVVFNDAREPMILGIKDKSLAITRRGPGGWQSPQTIANAVNGETIEAVAFQKIPGQSRAVLMWTQVASATINLSAYAHFVNLDTLELSNRFMLAENVPFANYAKSQISMAIEPGQSTGMYAIAGGGFAWGRMGTIGTASVTRSQEYGVDRYELPLMLVPMYDVCGAPRVINKYKFGGNATQFLSVKRLSLNEYRGY